MTGLIHSLRGDVTSFWGVQALVFGVVTCTQGLAARLSLSLSGWLQRSLDTPTGVLLQAILQHWATFGRQRSQRIHAAWGVSGYETRRERHTWMSKGDHSHRANYHLEAQSPGREPHFMWFPILLARLSIAPRLSFLVDRRPCPPVSGREQAVSVAAFALCCIRLRLPQHSTVIPLVDQLIHRHPARLSWPMV